MVLRQGREVKLGWVAVAFLAKESLPSADSSHALSCPPCLALAPMQGWTCPPWLGPLAAQQQLAGRRPAVRRHRPSSSSPLPPLTSPSTCLHLR